MFGVGMPELMIIFVIALLVFGPKELPKIARTLGKAMAELRRASDELRDGIQREIDNATKEEPEPPPVTPEPVPSAESVPVTPAASAEESPPGMPSTPGAEPADQQLAEAPGHPQDGEAAVASPASAVQLTIPTLSGAPTNGRDVAADPVTASAPPEAAAKSAPKPETASPPPAQPAGTRNA